MNGRILMVLPEHPENIIQGLYPLNRKDFQSALMTILSKNADEVALIGNVKLNLVKKRSHNEVNVLLPSDLCNRHVWSFGISNIRELR